MNGIKRRFIYRHNLAGKGGQTSCTDGESLTLGRASHRWIYRLAKVCGPHRSTAFRTASSVTESLGKDPNGSTTSQRQISVKPVAPQKTPTNKAKHRCGSVNSLGFPRFLFSFSGLGGKRIRMCSSNQPTRALCDESKPLVLAE